MHYRMQSFTVIRSSPTLLLSPSEQRLWRSLFISHWIFPFDFCTVLNSFSFFNARAIP